uniref:hypothetical protein n=1 Tax=Inonotus hispidus TaxID=40469 RepID=UPI0021824BB2|nr:hypothetical protein N4M07_mgp038 [Inonotus hispidus]UVF38014.1 hypothetical protein [Inonotus hispidus]
MEIIRLQHVSIQNGVVILKFKPVSIYFSLLSTQFIAKGIFRVLTSFGFSILDERIAKFIRRSIDGKNVKTIIRFIDLSTLEEKEEELNESTINSNNNDLIASFIFTYFRDLEKAFLRKVLKTIQKAIKRDFDLNEKICLKQITIEVKGGDFESLYDPLIYQTKVLRDPVNNKYAYYLATLYDGTIIKKLKNFKV